MLRNAFTSTRFIRTGPQIESRDFDGHRVDVRVPKQITPETPMLLIHDGMNVFFSKFASSGDTWRIREAIDEKRLVAEPLVVAIWGEGGKQKYNPRRINEFLCDDIVDRHPELWSTLLPALTPPTREPRGNYFLHLVADQILPTIIERYALAHSPARTALAGCSVAGVASIYWLAKRPDVFGAAFALSAHWEFGGRTLIKELTELLGDARGRMIWSDSGTEGLDEASCPLNDDFGRVLAANPTWRNKVNLETPTFWGTGHHETFWANRVEYPVNWWLKAIAEAKS